MKGDILKGIFYQSHTRRIGNSPLVVSIGIIMVFCLVSASPASQIEFTFSGNANFATAPNTQFTGGFTYDTTTPPVFPGSSNYYAITQGYVDIFNSSHSISALIQSHIFIGNDFMGTDEFDVWLEFTPQHIPIPGGTDYFDLIKVSLQDTTGTMFSDNTLPQDLSFLSHVNYERIDFLYTDDQNHLQPTAETEDVSLQARILPGTSVPEPGTMLLLGSGLIGLWGFRKKVFKK